MNKKQLVILFVMLISNFGITQFYQGSYQEFGHNRVQYNSFSWKSHNYARFKIYYSGINEEIAVYVARTMHHYLQDAELKLDYKFPEKLEVIVYESQSKFRQSNLGINNEEYSNVGGTSRIVGSKVFIYFEGDHQQFNRNIKQAVYEVLLKHMLFGGDWKDQLKTGLNSGMPLWLQDGLLNYFVYEWDDVSESRLKDLILTKKIDKFNKLTDAEKVIAGQAIWNYIAETHGATLIPNIIYITRVTRNVERAFFSLLGMDFVNLNKNYISFYRSRYIEEYKNQQEAEGELVKFKIKKESVYYGAKISPDGDKVAYVENQSGRYRVKVLDIASGKSETIFAAEPKMDRIQDFSYPVLGWHPTVDALTFFTERKGVLKMCIYTFSDKELIQKDIKDLDKILSFNYSSDGKKMIYSGVVRGQSDLYLLDLNSQSRKQITDDVYDDLDPVFIENNSRILFASNRTSDTIFKSPEIDFINTKNDIFIYNLAHVGHTYKYLEQITQTPDANETKPFETNYQQYVFLSDQNGINNRFMARKDSVISFIDTVIHYRKEIVINPQTNYVTSILDQHTNKKNELIYMIYQNNQFKLMMDKIDTRKVETLWNTTYIEKRNKRKARNEKRKDSPLIPNDTIYVGDMKYQRVIVDLGNAGQVIANPNLTQKDSIDSNTFTPKFKPPKYTLYAVNFAKDYVLSQFDNNFLFPNYQPYSGPGSVYFNPGINAMIKIGASDLFDDYKLLGGIRIPTNLNSGGEFMFMAQNLRQRTDHRLIVYRQKTINTSGFYKAITHDIRYRISYPISEILAFRTTLNLRKDNQIFIPYSDQSLARESVQKYNSGLNFELVFDNTLPIELNILRGTRFKIFGEYLQELGNTWYPTFNFGLDFRNYTRITRNFIWVNRIAAASSIGDRKLLHYMGGVDNWILRPQTDFDQTITVDPSQNFAFQTIATPMRGFIQNVRNGNSFILFNTELRLPIFTFFSTYPIKSDLVRHFQIVLFGDAGTAWTGPHPFSSENYFNTQEIQNTPVTINLQNLREPIIGGAGFGFRSKVWGYFVRFDVAWGIEDLEIQKPLTYVSLTKDI